MNTGTAMCCLITSKTHQRNFRKIMKITNSMIEPTKRKHQNLGLEWTIVPWLPKMEESGWLAVLCYITFILPLRIVLTVISSPPGSSLFVQGPHYLGTPESFEFLTDVVVKPFKRFQLQIPKKQRIIKISFVFFFQKKFKENLVRKEKLISEATEN